MKNDIFISNLPSQVSDNDLKKLFSKYGKVLSAKVIIDKASGKSKGFGFIRMYNEEDVIKTTHNLNGINIDGKTIKVEKSKSNHKQIYKINY